MKVTFSGLCDQKARRCAPTVVASLVGRGTQCGVKQASSVPSAYWLEKDNSVHVLAYT